MAKREIKKADTTDIIENDDLIIRETSKVSTKKALGGRPKKFKKDMNKKIQIMFTEGQLKAIEDRMLEIGITVKTDYFRKLIRADIENFDEL